MRTADLKFCNLAAEVPRHEALSQQFHAMLLTSTRLGR